MKFKLDENLPPVLVLLLDEAGHDAVHVLDQDLGGAPDPEVATVCKNEGRALVTLDLDFADIRTYPPAEFPGIVVLRTSRLDRISVLDLFRKLLPVLEAEPIAGKLLIVDESRVRIRG